MAARQQLEGRDLLASMGANLAAICHVFSSYWLLLGAPAAKNVNICDCNDRDCENTDPRLRENRI